MPFVLVVDDVDRLTDHAATDLATGLIANVPDESMVLLAGRSCRLDVVARLRAGSTVAELGVEELALDVDGVALVLAGLGLEVVRITPSSIICARPVALLQNSRSSAAGPSGWSCAAGVRPSGG